ncbi:uncharacterized protein BJ212DRAFT_1295018 [Suillus subaureus]|uniref:Uncharacterized protein n=1 Tax=Suillus subaureus TaxID=48587 RepID=A0A9P7ELN9_9AGAM|nr:uncharacterized protein BJ212DRAFT_1295018 [Suillus subaureus]KAG1825614.1 hypothetical protein BJ212DRAFT_1295018 [Suillus subaureus]
MREADAYALSLFFSLKFAALCLSNLPGSSVTSEVREAVLEAGVWAIDAARSLLCNRISKRSWADQMTDAALLHFTYHLPAWRCSGEQGDYARTIGSCMSVGCQPHNGDPGELPSALPAANLRSTLVEPFNERQNQSSTIFQCFPPSHMRLEVLVSMLALWH